MKILVLEDSEFRIDWFLRVMDGHNLYVVRTEEEAKIVLSQIVFDEIWFDHDLGVNNGDGMGVAKYLTELVLKKGYPNTPVVKIHSMNTPAAISMKKILDLAFKNVKIESFVYMSGHMYEWKEEYKNG